MRRGSIAAPLLLVALLILGDQLHCAATAAAPPPPPPPALAPPPRARAPQPAAASPPPPRRPRQQGRRRPPAPPPPPPKQQVEVGSPSPPPPSQGAMTNNSSSSSSSSSRTRCSTLLVFGDSTVDPGNNNRLRTTAKANFLPYGINLLRPTGRFSNGRLATDILADRLGIARTIPGFLDPTLKLGQLRKGVSFASAGSGYDDATASTLRAMPFHRQVWHLWRYKLLVRALLGPRRAERLVNRATFVISAGTNDMLLNYIASAPSSNQSQSRMLLPLLQYQNHLISRLANYTQVMRILGGRRFVLVGLPPIGCLPIARTLLGNRGGCDTNLNQLAASFNSRLIQLSNLINYGTDTRSTYVDTYAVIQAATENPPSFGMSEVTRGCCGSGMIEVGQTCRGRTTCQDPTRYLYWDAVHPTERTNQLIADVMLNSIRQIYTPGSTV